MDNILSGNPSGTDNQETGTDIQNSGTENQNEVKEGTDNQETGTDNQNSETDNQETSVPISYTDFNVPGGFEQPDASFLELTKGMGINQEGVQGLVDYYCQQLVPKMQAQQQQILDGWEAQSRKEFSKEDLDIANKAFGSLMKEVPELHDIVRDSGLGVHPKFIKAMLVIGKKMTEGSIIGNGQAVQKEKSTAEILFPGI